MSSVVGIGYENTTFMSFAESYFSTPDKKREAPYFLQKLLHMSCETHGKQEDSVLLFRKTDKDKACNEQDDKGKYAVFGIIQEVCTCRDDERAEKVCELTEYIKKSKIFAGFIFGDELAKVGAGQSLNAALADADRYCQYPEFRFGVQSVTKYADAHVHKNKDFYHTHGAEFFCERTAPDGTRESNELGQEQSEYHRVGIDADLAAVSSRHGDDGVNAVDIAEVSDDEKEHPLIFGKLFESIPKAAECVRDNMLLPGDAVALMYVFIERYCHDDPPCHSDDKRNTRCSSHGNADGIAV